MSLKWSALRQEGWMLVVLVALIAAIVSCSCEEVIEHHLVTKLLILCLKLYVCKEILVFTTLQGL